MSLLLKTLEILVDRHIRDDVLGKSPLHINQHGYQSGKSTDTALNSVVSTIEKALELRKLSLEIFLISRGLERSNKLSAAQSWGYAFF